MADAKDNSAVPTDSDAIAEKVSQTVNDKGATNEENIREKSLLDISEGAASTTTTKTTTTTSSLTPAAQPPPPLQATANVNGGTTSTNDARILELEQQLAASHAMVNALKRHQEPHRRGPNHKNNKGRKGEDSLFMELQQKLQSEMASKAETEHKLRLAEKQIVELQTHGQEQTAEFEKYRGLEDTLQQTLQAKDDAENSLSMALERIEGITKEMAGQLEKIRHLEHELIASREAMAAQEQELQKIREQRDEQERREMSLTNRLNQAKKKEAGKTNEAEKYEEQLTKVMLELEKTRVEVVELRKTKERLQKELEETIISSRHRQVQTETALNDERRLNEERKQKMKLFIEKKSEEIRQAKEDNEALQSELNQTTRSLSELNIRWKQLHAQWVQSQTRNRELQRDLHRIKKDSETLHKVGDTLEMKLSRSATETEEHKNKRLAAKHELMTVLRTLEAEREITARLRDSIKFTFTPKALSQQQLLNESVEDFETQLVKLSIRLRKPLPPPNDDSTTTANDDDGWVETIDELGNDDPDNSHFNRSDIDTHRLIEKLNRETQQVSKCIMAFVASIERMHLLLDSSGDRTCYAVLNDIIGTPHSLHHHHHAGVGEGHVPVPTSNQQDNATSSSSGESQRFHSITSRQYRD